MSFKNILNQIETNLYVNAEEMNLPVVDRDLGVVLYFASLYSFTNKEEYKKKALKLFNKAISIFPSFDFGYSLVEGFEGVFWVVNYLKTHGILENEEVLTNLKPYLVESIEYDLKNHNYNLLHGCLGKMQYYMFSRENNAKESLHYINKVINHLYENRIEIDGLINWKDNNLKKDFSIKLFNGHTGVLSILLKIKELNYENTNIDYLISKLLSALLNSLKYPKVVSVRGKVQQEGESEYYNISKYHGDLMIAHSLYYSGIVLKREDLKKKAHELTLKVCALPIKNSGIMYFKDYSFFDIGIDNGLSGITFLLFRLNKWIKDPKIEESLNLWKEELEKNVLKVLKIKEKVIMPQVIQNEKGDYYYEENSLFEGVLGAGLVLLSLYYNKDSWSDYLTFY